MVGFDESLKDDMVTNYYSVSLSNSIIYTTKFNVDSTQIKMLCGYNSRNKLRWVSLTDSEGNILLNQTFLRYSKVCELGFNSNLKNLDYCVTLKRKDQTKIFSNGYDYLNWNNDFELLFLGRPYELSLRLESNYRKMAVGN